MGWATASAARARRPRATTASPDKAPTAIDLMFGTYYRPARDEFPPTGLAGPRVKPIEAATYGPLVAWRRMAGGMMKRGK